MLKHHLLLGHHLRHQYQLQWGQPKDPIATLTAAVLGLLLRVLSTMLDVDLFQKEVAGQGEAWGEVRPLQASILGVMAVYPPPRLHYPPHQL